MCIGLKHQVSLPAEFTKFEAFSLRYLTEIYMALSQANHKKIF